MTITERGLMPASYLDGPRPLRLRRGGTLRVLMQPRAAARLLEGLAAQADMNRVAVGVSIRAHVHGCIPRPLSHR